MVLLSVDNEDFSVETRNISPQHLLVRIEGFSLLSENGIRRYESREFESGGHTWKLVICPDGDESNKHVYGDHVSVYVCMVETDSLPVDWEVNAMFSIFLFNHILDNYTCYRGKVQRFHAMNPKWGFPNLISKNSLTDPCNGYLVDDKCVFGAEVFVIKSQRVIDHVSVQQVTYPHKHSLVISQYSKLKGFWDSEAFTAGDHQWWIKLYPNGHKSGEGHYVSIYLYPVNCKSFAMHEKMWTSCSMCIKNKIHNKHCTKKFSEWFSSSHTGYGFPKFIPIGDMQDPRKGFVVDDCCFLEIEISVTAIVRGAPKKARYV
ncbi:hypothetical protein ACS0TY_020941 [Phlomoides rotata]